MHKELEPNKNDIVLGNYTFERLTNLFANIEHFDVLADGRHRSSHIMIIINGSKVYFSASDVREHPTRHTNIYTETISANGWSISIQYCRNSTDPNSKTVFMSQYRRGAFLGNLEVTKVVAERLIVDSNVTEDHILNYIETHIDLISKARQPPAMLEDWISSGLNMWVVCPSCRHVAAIPSSQIAGRFRKGGPLTEAVERLRCGQCDSIGTAHILPDIAQL